MIRIVRLDHLVLTVADVERTCAFYREVLGMEARTFEGRWALHFGNQKINLHQRGSEFELKAAVPTPGSGDLCFIAATPLGQVAAHLARTGIPIEEGPIDRVGAAGKLRSLYIRDPDRNLVEISNLAATCS